MTHNSGTMAGGMSMGSMHSGLSMGGADLNDVDYDVYLANERTLADPHVVRAAAGQGIRLRVINGASSTNFWIDPGQMSAAVIAVDGHAVTPGTGTRFPIAMAQRLDILLRLPNPGAYPILAQVAHPGASGGQDRSYRNHSRDTGCQCEPGAHAAHNRGPGGGFVVGNKTIGGRRSSMANALRSTW